MQLSRQNKIPRCDVVLLTTLVVSSFLIIEFHHCHSICLRYYYISRDRGVADAKCIVTTVVCVTMCPSVCQS